MVRRLSSAEWGSQPDTPLDGKQRSSTRRLLLAHYRRDQIGWARLFRKWRFARHAGVSGRDALNASDAHDASDEHSGAEVRAEHRPHLGAEQRTRAEDLGAPSD